MSQLKASVTIDLNGNVVGQSQRFQRSVENFAQSGSRKLAIMGRSVATVSNQIDRLGNRAALSGGAIGYMFNRTFVKTAAEFERFHTILETVEGSSQKADAAMKWVADFAAKTPYELAQVTDAFVRLRSYGMDPINGDLLRTLGDTSSAMGKPLEAAVEAIADAVTGENERLKEFGIKAAVQGKKIVYEYTMNGKTMRKSAKANSREQIASTLQSIWNEKYAGAMDKMSRNWDGLTSNLDDQWTQFQNRVMQAGAFDYLKREIDELLGTINELQTSGDMDAKAKQVSDSLITVFNNAKEAGKGLLAVLKEINSAVDYVAEHVGGYEKLAKILASVYVANKVIRGGASVVGGITAVAAATKNAVRGGSGAGVAAETAAGAAKSIVNGGSSGISVAKVNPWMQGVKSPTGLGAFGGVALKGLGLAGLAYSLDIPGSYRTARDILSDKYRRIVDPKYREQSDAENRDRMTDLFGNSKIRVEVITDNPRATKVTAQGDALDVSSSGRVMGNH